MEIPPFVFCYVREPLKRGYFLKSKEVEIFKYPKRFTKEQRFSLLSEYLRGGLSISELSRKHQVSAHTIYKWRNAMKEQQENQISLDPAELLCEIEQLKGENSRLKHTVAEQALDISSRP